MKTQAYNSPFGNRKRWKQDPREPHGGGRAYYIIIGSVLLALAAFLLYRRLSEDPDVREVRALLETARKAAIAKDVATCFALVDETFTDNEGHNYNDVKNAAKRDVSDVSDVSVRIRSVNVEMQENRNQATVKFEMRFKAWVQESMGRTIPIIGVTGSHAILGQTWEKVTLRCVQRRDGWKVSRAEIDAPRK